MRLRSAGGDAARRIGGKGFPVAGHDGILDIEGSVEGPEGAVIQGAGQGVEGRNPAAPEKSTQGRREASMPCAQPLLENRAVSVRSQRGGGDGRDWWARVAATRARAVLM